MNLGKILITNTFYCFYYENKKKIALRNQSDLIFRKVYFKISISPYKPQLGHMYRLSYDLRSASSILDTEAKNLRSRTHSAGYAALERE